MKNFTLFKRQMMFVVFMLLGCMSIHAADDGLITEQITIKLDKAGTLPDKIDDKKKRLITNLKIIGEINGTDVRLIRDMAGLRYLAILDLSEVRIVSGGDYYYSGGLKVYTENDKFGNYIFYDLRKLTSLIIPKSITSIGDCALKDCINLVSLDLPSSVTIIGDNAFSGCKSLTNLVIPASVTSIGASAFSGCAGLTSLTVPEGVDSIGKTTFYSCI